MTDLDPMMSAGSGRNDARARATDLLGRYSTGQKVAAGAAVVAVVLGVFFMTRMAGAGKYAPLFTDLQTSDAAAITEQLDAEGIPYQLVGGGTSILVPSDQVYSARLKVAADGIPSDSQVGYGVLDQQGLTTSEFGQRVGYQRAMEGELSTTIESLDVVETATVHLALPDKDAFALSDQKASASVLVSTTPGSSMSDEQVQTVVNLVASSIENLSPEAVTVADSEGNVLAAPGRNPGGAGGAGGAGGGGQKQTAQFEQSVAESIEAMLTKVVGPGATIATVSADLNFDETNVSRETFEAPAVGPDGEPLAVQDSTRNETYTGTAGAVAGVLGPDTPAATGGGDTDYSLDEADVEYALNRVVESTNTAPGAIERLSVAVMVDEEKVSPELLGNLDALVAAAAGIEPDRGDVLALDRMPFDTSIADRAEDEIEQAEEAEAAAATQQMMQSIALGVFLLVVLLVAFLMYRRAAKQRRKRAELLAELQLDAGNRPALTAGSRAGAGAGAASGGMDMIGGPAAGMAAGVQDYAPASLTAAGGTAAPVAVGGGVMAPARPALGTAVIDAGAQQRAATGVNIAQMADQQPDEVAHLMRGWLGDNQGGRS